MKDMTLQSEANRLIDVLDTVCVALDQYGVDYTTRCACTLRPLVHDLRTAVVEERSRDHAESLLSEIKPIMHEVNGAATKGELAIFDLNDDTLDTWWELSAIFQESRFAKDKL